MAAGKQNINALIDALDNGPGGPSFYVEQAIERVVKPSDKELIISKLEQFPLLAGVVVKNSWEEDAKPILLEGLSYGGHVDYNWIMALTHLNDPKVGAKLKGWILRHPTAFYYKQISKMPGASFSLEELEEAWGRTMDDKWNRYTFGFEVAAKGSKDALLDVADAINSQELDLDHMDLKPMAVAKLAGYDGPAKGFKDWFEKNRDHLEFDKAKGHFIVKGPN